MFQRLTSKSRISSALGSELRRITFKGWPFFPFPNSSSGLLSGNTRGLSWMNSSYEHACRSRWACFRSRSSKQPSGRNSLFYKHQTKAIPRIYDTGRQTGGKTTSRTNGRELKLGPDSNIRITINRELTDTWSIICTIAKLCCCCNARLSWNRTRDICSVSGCIVFWTRAFCICTTEVPSVDSIRSMAGHTYIMINIRIEDE